jgi:acyl dehydratase
MDISVLGHYFEDFTTGEIVRHSLSKTIFESDNNLSAC